MTAAAACRELDCGSAVSVEERKESSVRSVWWIWPDCVQSGSALRNCMEEYSSSSILYLSCSDPDAFRLVGGASRCAGTLELQYHRYWRPVGGYYFSGWTLKKADAVCRELDCGSAVSVEERQESSVRSVWSIRSDCVQYGYALRKCATSDSSSSILDITCSDSVRLVNGTSLCSGRLEVKTNQSTQRWSSVCEDDFDQQDAEVVCRELGCGAPSVLQGALYGEVEPPMWTKVFQCGGHESALLDCRSSISDRNTCSPGKAVGLTCSEPVRLVGGSSHCDGTLEVKQGEWRPLVVYPWTLMTAAAACRELDCGSAVSVEERKESPDRSVWRLTSNCVQSGSALRECAESRYSAYIQDLTCLDLLLQPNISVSSMDGVSEAQQQGFQVIRGSTFNISCSIQPQYPGGSFQLTFTSSNSTHNSTQPAVNHSAHFLFPAAEPAHQGTYSCVYHVYVFSHNFSSASRLLSLTVSGIPAGETRVKKLKTAGALEFRIIEAQQKLVSARPLTENEVLVTVGPQIGLGSIWRCGQFAGQRRLNGAGQWSHQDEALVAMSTNSPFKASTVPQEDGQDAPGPTSIQPEGVLQLHNFLSHWLSPAGSLVATITGTNDLLAPTLSSSAKHKALLSVADACWLTVVQTVQSSELLFQPNISVSSSMDGVSEAQQQGFQVIRGSTFNISCFIQQHYPGGSFQLTFTSSNSTHNSTQPAVNQSAHFLFPAAEPSHQGTYSCVYHLYVFPHNFSSASCLLSLTVSESVRLVGGASHCTGTLEVKHEEEWRPVDLYPSTLKTAAAACRELDCGSAVSVEERKESSDRSVWWIRSDCVESGSALRECAESSSSSSILHLSCLDSVRLVNGTSLCSGRLEVKTNQSTQCWSSVCENDFDQQDAEVVCRELGCGPPSVLQGALYGEEEPPMRTKEFQCGDHESALQDCRSSGSDSNTCSSGKAVRLTCSEPEAVRLVGGASRCAGTLEVKHHKEWRPVSYNDSNWPLKTAVAACRDLDCGYAVSAGQRKESSDRSVLRIRSNCVESGSALRECATSDYSSSILYLSCSDLLLQPNISVSSSMDGVSEAQPQGFQVFRGSTFNISCSIQPQYPGGSFQLTFTSSNSTHNSTQPAVNHFAHFLFPAAEPTHQGTYSCVYHLYVFSHNFSSESRLLSLTVSDASTRRPFIIRVVVFSLTLLLVITALSFYCKASRGLQQDRQNIELLYYQLSIATAEGWLTEEEGAQGAE
ncbi:hypothetical protein EPR50_G00200660 [Perca flavescens]|uniref:Uncharacterized protein n=1 Tax=Perca flavescens TaxID=8167 RepID=A0A484C3X7_PERFV|nr:hypothetical protein EPR50_G00200660 [Perca flavescens]